MKELKGLLLVGTIGALLTGIGAIPTGFVGSFGKRTPADFWDFGRDFYLNPKNFLILTPVTALGIVALIGGVIRRRINPKFLPLILPLILVMVGVAIFVLLLYAIAGCYLRLWLSGLWPALKDLPEKHAYSYLAFLFYFIWFAIIARTFLPKIYRENDL